MMITTTDNYIHNIALVGHGHVGKTSLAEAILHRQGVFTRLGSVDDGTSQLDTEPEEKERHLTINSHTAHFSLGRHRFNFIDTPGFPDFFGQVAGAMSAVETGLICIDAHKGVEHQTQQVWKMACKMNLVKMIIITKCESEQFDYEALLETLWENFGRHCLPVQLPIGQGSRLSGLVNLLEFEGSPDSVLDSQTMREMLIETAIDGDDELLEYYLEHETVPAGRLEDIIRNAIAQGQLVPIFCTSVKKGIGIDELMKFLLMMAPNFSELTRQVIHPDGSWDVLTQQIDAPLVAQVFKQKNDPYISKISYLRIYSGRLNQDSVVVNTRTGQQLKVHQVFSLQGEHAVPADFAKAGDIVALTKLDDLRTGDTLTNENFNIKLPAINFPQPMFGLAVEPKSQADQRNISTALHKMEDEDPTFIVHRDDITNEIIMMGMSDLHLSLVEEKLKNRDKVMIKTHLPRIPYRETITTTAEGSYRHRKQSGGAGQFAEVHLRISPFPEGLEPEEYFTREHFRNLREYFYDKETHTAFLDCIAGGSIPHQYIPAVHKGVLEKIHEGCFAGYRLQNMVIELFFGKDHPVDSNETAFKIAARKCLQEIFLDAQPILLEPLVKLDIYVPSDCIGAISADISSKRGHILGMISQPGGYQIITAIAPQSEMLTYARGLTSITGGKGSYMIEFSHYSILPYHEQLKVLKEQHELSTST